VPRRPGGADGTLAAMSCWQYAQLTITVDGRASREGPRRIVWHDPGQGVGENCSDSGQAVLELLNRFGADGWELAGLQDYRDGGDGTSYWGGGPAADGVHLQTARTCVARSQASREHYAITRRSVMPPSACSAAALFSSVAWLVAGGAGQWLSRARIRSGRAAGPVMGWNRAEAARSAWYSSSVSSMSAAAALVSSCWTLDAPGIATTAGWWMT
jgi:hypothetical protein